MGAGYSMSGTSRKRDMHTTRRARLLVNLNSRALRLSLNEPVQRDGKELFEVPICVTGAWVKNGSRFFITLEDLEAMVRNFEKRKNDQVVIDYEHASEQPDVARGGPVVAAGWIHALRLAQSGVTGSERGSGSDIGLTSFTPGDSRLSDSVRTPDVLNALVEWTPQAIEMIGTGQYRFFSPAIDWGCCDKETGEPQGATLTSAALTNHPFLEELPAITLSDVDREGGSADSKSGSPPGRPLEPGSTAKREDQTAMKKLIIRRLTEGPLQGHEGIFDNDEPLGYLDSTEFADYVKQRDGANDEAMSEMLRESGLPAAAPGRARDQVREELKLAAAARSRELEASAQSVLLAEAVRDGALDNRKAALLAREGRISLGDYIAAQEADRKLDDAVRAGKILPRDRRFFFQDALERPREFAEYVRQAAPVLRLGSEGIGAAGESSVDDEVRMRTQRLMSEEKIGFAKALRKVLGSDRELENRYHAVHRKEVGSDPEVVRESEGRGITA